MLIWESNFSPSSYAGLLDCIISVFASLFVLREPRVAISLVLENEYIRSPEYSMSQGDIVVSCSVFDLMMWGTRG